MFQGVNPLTRCWLYPGYIRATITLITPPFLLLNVGDIPIVSHSVPIYLHHVPITPAFFVGLTPLKNSGCIRHPTSRPQAFDFEVPIPPAPAPIYPLGSTVPWCPSPATLGSAPPLPPWAMSSAAAQRASQRPRRGCSASHCWR